jgi:hypothetical protein
MNEAGRHDQTVSMALRDWFFVDGSMDTASWRARHIDYDESAARTAGRIREAGWAATGHLTGPALDSGKWPPPGDVQDQMVTVTLTADEWIFVLSALRRDVGAETHLGRADDAARGKAVLGVVTATLVDLVVEPSDDKNRYTVK